MTDGPRQRGSAAPSTSEDGAADTGKAAGQSVALKKEIGLVSACGIIVGEILNKNASAMPMSNWCSSRSLLSAVKKSGQW
uniref:Uncharacterized protein n=1 Tax=Sinocyclocheilus grahami TaxID=75366 RepID=A0A672S059_SINGR